MRKVRFQHNCRPARLVHPLFISLQVQPGKATRGARVTRCDDPGEVQGRCCGCPLFVQDGFKCTVDGLRSLWLRASWMSTSQGLWTHRISSSTGTSSVPKASEKKTRWPSSVHLSKAAHPLKEEKKSFKPKGKNFPNKILQNTLLVDPGNQSNLDSQICAFSFLPTDFQ